MKITFQDRYELAKELAVILKATKHHVTRSTSKTRSMIQTDFGTITITEDTIELSDGSNIKQFETPISLKNEVIVLS